MAPLNAHSLAGLDFAFIQANQIKGAVMQWGNACREAMVPDEGRPQSMLALRRGWLDDLQLARQLMNATWDIQEHRGASMAVLSGDAQFMSSVRAIGLRIERRFGIIEQLLTDLGLRSILPWDNVVGGWATVCEGWRGDDVIHNFEFHCYLVEQMLNAIKTLLRRAEQWQGSPLQDFPLKFVLVDLPQQTESIGRLRALATHVTAARSSDVLLVQKIRFLIRQVSDQQTSLNHQASKLVADWGRSASAFMELQLNDGQLQRLLGLLDAVTQADWAKVDSARHVFDQASRVMLVYSRAVEQGVSLAEQAVDAHLEYWIVHGVTRKGA